MLLLVPSMHLRIIGFLGLDYLEDDLEQPLAQAPQCTRMRHSLASFLAVIGLTPSAGAPKAIGPQVHRVPQEFVATPADLDLANPAGLKRHGSSSGQALQHILGAITLGVAANGC